MPAKLDPKAEGAAVFQTLCLPCHGDRGQGNDVIKAPSIAGLPAWYVRQQLDNFRAGRRGVHAQDTAGLLMNGAARLLQPAQVESIASVVAGMPVVPAVATAALLRPNMEEGRLLYGERCMECHRFNGSGELTFGSPPLTGLQDWYLLAQIDKFKSGLRGAHSQDANGAKMAMAARLFIDNEQAKHDVVAFIMSLNPGTEAVKSDGEALFDKAAKGTQP